MQHNKFRPGSVCAHFLLMGLIVEMPPAGIKTSKCIRCWKQIADQAVDHQDRRAPLRPFVTLVFTLVFFFMFTHLSLLHGGYGHKGHKKKHSRKTVPGAFLFFDRSMWLTHFICSVDFWSPVFPIVSLAEESQVQLRKAKCATDRNSGYVTPFEKTC